MATWIVDPAHTLLEFSVKHMMLSTVKGRFTKFEGTVEGALPDLTTATANLTVDVSSVSTGEAQRDGHLRSGDFFDTEHFPEMTFRSIRIVRSGDNEYKVTGELTIHGVTKEVVLDATFEGQGKDPYGRELAAISLEGKINRKDWGLVWNVALETGGILVGEQVKIVVSAELIKQPAAASA